MFYNAARLSFILFVNVLQKSPNSFVFLDDQTTLITITYWDNSDNHNNLIKTNWNFIVNFPFFRQEILKIYTEDDVVKEVVISLEKSLALMRCITELQMLKQDYLPSIQVSESFF